MTASPGKKKKRRNTIDNSDIPLDRSPQSSQSPSEVENEGNRESDGAKRDFFSEGASAANPEASKASSRNTIDNRNIPLDRSPQSSQSPREVENESNRERDGARRNSFSEGASAANSEAYQASADRVNTLMSFIKRPTNGQFLTAALGVPIDMSRSKIIPQEIHRFWSGGKLSDAAMQVLRESAEKTRDTNWSNTLWYSRSLEDAIEQDDPDGNIINLGDRAKRDTQRIELIDLGYKVRPIEDLALPDPVEQGRLRSMFSKMGLRGTPPPPPPGTFYPKDFTTMAQKAVDKIKSGGSDRWDGIKHLSDIARLIYLQQVGGHHFDVDIGLGTMDLSRGYYHNDYGQVPLFGSVTATSTDPIARQLEVITTTQGEGKFQDSAQRDSAIDVAIGASEMAGFLNGMIATAPDNPRFGNALTELKKDAIAPGGEIPSGMTVSANLLYGNEDARAQMSEEEKRRVRGLAVPAYLLDLQHLTDESDSR